ncbi:MAG: hypothetical protein K2J04_02290 [Lachnospiraceae bacterium]|nr:hypothetical protein [Lachnospiraceae bacterium]
MRKKIITFISALVFLFTMTTITGCAHEAKAGGNTVQSVSGVQGETAAQDEQADAAVGNMEETAPADSPVDEQVEAEPAENTEPSETTEKVEYSHEDIYLSLTIPDGWGYKIRTAEEMEKYDGMTICAIEFWQEDYPETVFTFSYESFFGICGTGVTEEEFTQENGISGYRFTEEIEDTLWLNMIFRNPEDVDEEGVYKGGTYCIMASPKLSEWDVIEPEFEEIVKSIWVGSH